MAKKYTVERALRGLNNKIEARGQKVFATKSAALTALIPGERFVGQAAWIISEKAIYRFIDGVGDGNFIPDNTQFCWTVH